MNYINYLTENSDEKYLYKNGNIFIVNRNEIKMKFNESYSPNKELLSSPDYINYNSKITKEYNKNINKTNNIKNNKILKEHKLILLKEKLLRISSLTSSFLKLLFASELLLNELFLIDLYLIK